MSGWVSQYPEGNRTQRGKVRFRAETCLQTRRRSPLCKAGRKRSLLSPPSESRRPQDKRSQDHRGTASELCRCDMGLWLRPHFRSKTLAGSGGLASSTLPGCKHSQRGKVLVLFAQTLDKCTPEHTGSSLLVRLAQNMSQERREPGPSDPRESRTFQQGMLVYDRRGSRSPRGTDQILSDPNFPPGNAWTRSKAEVL